ncbi:hypothetical protein [Massilia sp. TWP1-3-3]|uniref:hypothetical protein n=1 Tax=Massilia sp. TWP1-3-3 TaxID=2804573 RepID=UPI003CF6B29E
MSDKAFAIGLYCYTAPSPGADGFKAFYDLITNIFIRIGIAPTYFAAEGTGYNGNLTKFGARTHAKALKSGFSDIHVMSLVANPAGSAEPGYDSYASASLSYVEEIGETLFCLAIEERFLEFSSDDFNSILMSCIALQRWDFGYAVSQPVQKKPEFHVLGLDAGELTVEDQTRLNKWYASLPEARLIKIRDVYPVNVLNNTQLNARVSVSQSLTDVIREDKHSSLRLADDGQLWLWEVEPDGLDDLRNKLAAGDVLIT